MKKAKKAKTRKEEEEVSTFIDDYVDKLRVSMGLRGSTSIGAFGTTCAPAALGTWTATGPISGPINDIYTCSVVEEKLLTKKEQIAQTVEFCKELVNNFQFTL